MRMLSRLLIALIASGIAGTAQPQDVDQPMAHHGDAVLFVAQASAANVVPAGNSAATGTGAFIFDRVHGSLTYDITIQGLENGPPTQVSLHNFDLGGNGNLVKLICGEGAPPCPNETFGNLSGSWTDGEHKELDSYLLGELASARIYLEVVGGDGKPEIRGQLEPNGAMVPVRSFVAHLSPLNADAKGIGTAVLSEAYLPEGRVAVFFEVTAAGTSSAIRGAALVGDASAELPDLRFDKPNTLVNLDLRSSPDETNGGTLTGTYQVLRSQPEAVFATNILSAGNRAVGVTVSTGLFADGELYGAFEPVN